VNVVTRLAALSFTLFLWACAAPSIITPANPSGPRATVSPAPPADHSLRAQIAGLPLAFEPNRGQAASNVHYVGRGPGMRVELTRDGARLTPAARGDDGGPVHLRLLGGGQAPAVLAEDELPGRIHYYSGADPSRWLRDVPT